MFRSFAERIARNLVFRRRLPAAFGRRPFFVTPDSALAYMTPGFSKFSDLIAIASISIKEDDCVWDIGGNLGIFSFLASHKVGPRGTVVCVEPDPVLASLVQRSAQLSANSVFPVPAFIKIDVEGAELLVLQGGRTLLEEFRPRLYIEVAAHHSEAVSAILRSCHYQLFDGTQPLMDQQPLSKCVFNTLAVPIEQLNQCRVVAA